LARSSVPPRPVCGAAVNIVAHVFALADHCLDLDPHVGRGRREAVLLVADQERAWGDDRSKSRSDVVGGLLRDHRGPGFATALDCEQDLRLLGALTPGCRLRAPCAASDAGEALRTELHCWFDAK
jgi:hypothetical protein